MLFKVLNGAASPANCAKNIAGPLIVLIVSSTPPCLHDKLLRRALFYFSGALMRRESQHISKLLDTDFQVPGFRPPASPHLRHCQPPEPAPIAATRSQIDLRTMCKPASGP